MATRRGERRVGDSGRRSGPEGRKAESDKGFAFTSWSLGVGGAGIVLAVGAFALVARGEITLAPLLLVVAYLVLFPVALVMRDREPRGG